MCGDGTRVHCMPPLNILFISGDEPPLVLGIKYCSKYMAAGGTKNASYIADLFCNKINKLDPDGSLLTFVF